MPILEFCVHLLTTNEPWSTLARMSTSEAPAPGSTASLRPANTRRVLDLVREADSSYTQAELARATGLAAATVSTIVRDLARSGLIETQPGSGRRGTLVRLSRAAGLVVGVDVGHSHLAVALGDLAGRVVAERRRPLAADHPAADALRLASGLLEETLHETGHTMSSVRTVGLGLPAPVTDRLVRTSAILPGWVDVQPAELAHAQFERPVEVDNDANLGALAEHRVGAAVGEDNVVYVKASSGVGAGLLVNGQILRGANGTAGEIGHLTLDERGPVCRCGSRGCLEAYTSTESLLELLQTQVPDATLVDLVGPASGHDVAAGRLIEDAGLHLGWGLASVVNLLNPGVIVIGGELAEAGDPLLSAVHSGLRRHALPDVAATPVVLSGFGDRAAVVGALLLAADATELVV